MWLGSNAEITLYECCILSIELGHQSPFIPLYLWSLPLSKHLSTPVNIGHGRKVHMKINACTDCMPYVMPSIIQSLILAVSDSMTHDNVCLGHHILDLSHIYIWIESGAFTKVYELKCTSDEKKFAVNSLTMN